MGFMTADQKANRKKSLLSLNKLGGIIASDGETTMVWWPEFKGSKMGSIAFSTCNPTDKFRRKFGEYQAIKNLHDSNGSVLVRREIAVMLADIFIDWR